MPPDTCFAPGDNLSTIKRHARTTAQRSAPWTKHVDGGAHRTPPPPPQTAQKTQIQIIFTSSLYKPIAELVCAAGEGVLPSTIKHDTRCPKWYRRSYNPRRRRPGCCHASWTTDPKRFKKIPSRIWKVFLVFLVCFWSGTKRLAVAPPDRFS